jgi:hypothetical protein
VVRDANGQALGYFYFEEEPGQRSAAKMLTKDDYRSCCGRSTPRQAMPAANERTGFAHLRS